MTEAALHAAVAQYLDLALPSGTIWHHSPQQNTAHVAWRAKLKRAGTKTGWPDIQILWNGGAYFIELKTARGRVTDAQQRTMASIAAAGSFACVCRSLAEVEAILREWNIPLKGKAT